MKHSWLAMCAIVGCGVLALSAPNACAQASSGSLEFTAQVRPTDGHAEPVRQMSFYLLSKSMDDIRAEAERSAPPPDRDHFIDGLEVSTELKAWMKKHDRVDLTGEDFTKHLTADDIIGIPEFLEAYKNINGASLNSVIADAKLKESDKKKNPEKYQRELDAHKVAMHHFIETNPDTLDGLDAELRDKNPGQRWAKAQADQRRSVEHRTLELAQTRYLVAETDSDLAGRGTFTGIAAGHYWITTLDTPALAGDARLRWDDPVTIRAGQTAHAELSNVNARETAEQAIQ